MPITEAEKVTVLGLGVTARSRKDGAGGRAAAAEWSEEAEEKTKAAVAEAGERSEMGDGR